MRVSRLHLLLALIGLGIVGYGVFLWLSTDAGFLNRPSAAKNPMPVVAQPEVAKPSVIYSHTPENTARTLAIIGEAYRPLVRQFGDVSTISGPLKEAKGAFAKGDYSTATTSAGLAWVALKDFREKMRGTPGYYEVQKGDTLWAIAKAHSPIHRGPAWVAIWRANKAVIDDFDHVDAGLFLKIPARRSQYSMPFWKPHGE